MKRRTCDECGETVVLADEPAEVVTSGETPVEHMTRTGHSPCQPTLMKCRDCENIWAYTGSATRPTCPNCQGKAVTSAER